MKKRNLKKMIGLSNKLKKLSKNRMNSTKIFLKLFSNFILEKKNTKKK